MTSVQVFFTLMFSELRRQQKHGYHIREKQDNCCCCHLLTAKAKNNLASTHTRAHHSAFVYIRSHSKGNASRQTLVDARHTGQKASSNCDAAERSEQVFVFHAQG